MTFILYRGRVAALAAGRVHLAPHVDALEPDHPIRRFVGGMALVARAVEQGDQPGPYDDAEAESIVRAGLIPAGLFGVLRDRPDWWLAELFQVPLEQVGERRRELAALRA